jgi:hypothetical protein
MPDTNKPKPADGQPYDELDPDQQAAFREAMERAGIDTSMLNTPAEPSHRVADALARIARYPRPLSPADREAVKKEMVEFLLGGQASAEIGQKAALH